MHCIKDGDKKKKKTQKIFPVIAFISLDDRLESIQTYFANMPKKIKAAHITLTNLSPARLKTLKKSLDDATDMDIHIAGSEPISLDQNKVYLVSHKSRVYFKEGALIPASVKKGEAPHSSVDLLLSSIAEEKKEQAVIVIASGATVEGIAGIKELREQGGVVVVQDPKYAPHRTMPAYVINSGFADFIAPGEIIPQIILNYISHPCFSDLAENAKIDPSEREFTNGIIAFIEKEKKISFSFYKKNTLLRRIKRRMGLAHITDYNAYLDFLEQDGKEMEHLFSDFLIGVTSFFRDPQVWEMLRKQVLPGLIADADPMHPLRVWIPGCATGEEVYTMAVILSESFDEAKKNYNAQIFASDIDESALAVARTGIYSAEIEAHVSPDRLKRFFVKTNRQYHVRKDLRDSIIFSNQNLISDAPFSRLDLISCRNLLIYFEPALQKKIIRLFHFALKDHGALLLGASESISHYNDLFETISNEAALYRRLPAERFHKLEVPLLQHGAGSRESYKPSPALEKPESLKQLTQQLLVKEFSPTAIIINRKYEILYFHGPTERYFDLPKGEPEFDIISMAKKEIKMKLRAALVKGMHKNESQAQVRTQVKMGKESFILTITVKSLRDYRFLEELYLVTFTEERLKSSKHKDAPLKEQDYDLVRQLEEELRSMRKDLRNTIDELESSNEELKASNEEMMSMNEELRSSNEELETSREELQSLNEELNMVNAELHSKIAELEDANNDLINFMNSTETAMIFLDCNLRIRRFTPATVKLFNLISSDIGRPIKDFTLKFQDEDLHNDAEHVRLKSTPIVKEVKTEEGTWYIRRILPFRTQHNTVKGIVLAFDDVTELKKAEISLKENESWFRTVLDRTATMVFNQDLDLRYTRLYNPNVPFDGKPIIGHNDYDLYPQEEAQRLTELKHRVISSGEGIRQDFSATIDGEERFYDLTIEPLHDADGKTTGITCSAMDITKRKTAERELERYRNHLEEIVNTRTEELEREIKERKWTESVLAQSLREKEILLQEIHHRVKNNLQIISGLIDMAIRRTDFPEAGLALRDVQSKIQSMAHIHVQLYESDNFDRVDLSHFIQSFWTNLSFLYQVQHVSVYFMLEPVVLSMETAIPCGLVINEIFTNVIKHAFPQGRRGELRISLKKSGDLVDITIADNGVGIPDITGIAAGKHLGIKLMRNIIEGQLRGTVTIDGSEGTTIRFLFKSPERKKGKEDGTQDNDSR